MYVTVALGSRGMAISRCCWLASQWEMDSLKDPFPKSTLTFMLTEGARNHSSCPVQVREPGKLAADSVQQLGAMASCKSQNPEASKLEPGVQGLHQNTYREMIQKPVPPPSTFLLHLACDDWLVVSTLRVGLLLHVTDPCTGLLESSKVFASSFGIFSAVKLTPPLCNFRSFPKAYGWAPPLRLNLIQIHWLGLSTYVLKERVWCDIECSLGKRVMGFPDFEDLLFDRLGSQRMMCPGNRVLSVPYSTHPPRSVSVPPCLERTLGLFD